MWEIVMIVVFLVIGFLLGFYFYVSAGDKVQVFASSGTKAEEKESKKKYAGGTNEETEPVLDSI